MKDKLNTLSLREIKSSFKRFLSLVVMSMLGVGVFVGLKMSAPDMIKSLDAYYDNDNHYDIKVVSTLGLTDNDIKALRKIKGVKQVEGSYSKDVIININNDESVIKIIGIEDKINKIKPEKGRMPKQDNEILVEQNLLDEQKLKIGNKINISDDDFNEKELKIVGTVKSSMYISSTTGALNRGNTTIGSGHISYYVYGLNSNFNMNYFTEIYVTVNDAIEKITDSDEYNNLVNRSLTDIDKIKKIQAKARYDEIYNKINNEIIKNETEGLEKLDGAKNKLDSSKKILDNSKNELDDANSKLISAKYELDENYKKLEEAKNALDLYDSKLKDARNEIDDAKEKINNELRDYNLTYEDVDNVINILEDYEVTKEEAISLIPADIQNYDSVVNAITSIYDSVITASIKEYIEGNITKENLINNIPNNIPYYDDVINFINNTTREDIINYITDTSNIDNIINNIPNNIPYHDNVIDLLNAYKSSVDNIVDLVSTIKKIDNGEEEYKANVINYNNLYKDYNEGYDTYNNYYNEYQNNLSTYNNGLRTYNVGLTLYNNHIKEYYEQRKMFDLKILEAKKKLDEIPESKWYTYNRLDDSSYTSFIDDGDSVTNLSKLFPTIFFIVAILISLISSSRMVEDDRAEIGTLKSLGFSNKYIRKKYLLYSGSATILGGLIGATLGFFLLPYIVFNIYKILFDIPLFKYDFNPTNSIIGILISVICISGTTILTIRKVVKEKPSDLMRPRAPANGKRILLERIKIIWDHINFSNKITARNLFRYKKRVFMMVFGILGCTSLLLAGFGIRDAIVDIPSKQFSEVFHFDDMVYLNDVSKDEADNIFNGISKNRLDTMMSSSYEVDNNSVYVMAVNDEKDIKNVLELNNIKTKKKISLKNNMVIISDKLADLINKKKNDKITIKGPDNEEYVFVISDVFENYAAHYIIMDKNTYQNNIGEYKINASYINLINKNNENKEIKKIMSNENVISIMSVKSTIKSVDDMLKSLNSVVLILIILSGSLSFVILYNLSYINISERKREIATLKVLGFTDKEVDNYIVKETIILTIIGIILGLLFGILLSRIIVDTIEISMVRFLRHINLISFIITTLFIMGFTFIVNFITHFALKKIDMIESLKSVE